MHELRVPVYADHRLVFSLPLATILAPLSAAHDTAQVRWFSFEWSKHAALAEFDYVWRMDVDLWLKFPVGVLK